MCFDESCKKPPFTRAMFIDGSKFHGQYLKRVGLKVKLCLFVLNRPTHNLPPTKKIILRFRGGKIFLSFAAKCPIACQESGFNHTC